MFDLIPPLLLVLGVACFVHGVRQGRAELRAWATAELEEIRRTDMRDWYRQEP